MLMQIVMTNVSRQLNVSIIIELKAQTTIVYLIQSLIAFQVGIDILLLIV